MEFTYTKPLAEEVPKEIRLEVYKKAKELIENWYNSDTKNFGLVNPQLCLILPCILYNQETYLDNDNEWNDWYPHETVLGFTDFTNEDIDLIWNSNNQNKKRLELVNKWIEQLNK